MGPRMGGCGGCGSKNGVKVCPNPASLFLRSAGVGSLSPALGLCVLVVCSLCLTRESHIAKLNFLFLYKVMPLMQMRHLPHPPTPV